jgi:hypothetical protein
MAPLNSIIIAGPLSNGKGFVCVSKLNGKNDKWPLKVFSMPSKASLLPFFPRAAQRVFSCPFGDAFFV